MIQGRTFPLTFLSVAVSAALVMNPAQAQSENELIDETMVVTGRVSSLPDIVIDADQLQKRQANDLSDIFRTDPEVSIGGGSSVSQKIYVRGLEDTMLNVSIDGATQSGYIYHHQGQLSIEPELLQQVEVSAGAGRATDGAGALGGAIRFKTKDPSDLLWGDQRYGALVKAGYYDNTEGYKTSLSGYGYLTDTISALATLSYSDLDNFTDGNGDEQAHTGAENKVGFVKLVGEFTESQKLTLSYDRREDEAFRYHRPQWVESFKNVPINQEMIRETYTGNYLFDPANNSWLALDVTVYGTETSLEHIDGPWGDYLGEAKSYGADIRNTSTFAGKHNVTYGVEYRDDEGTLGSPIYGSDKDSGKVKGVYAQGDIYLIDTLLLSLGGRYDEYELQESNGPSFDHSGFSPNASLTYEVLPGLSVYGGYAEAVRGAQVREIFKLDGSNSSEDRKEERAKNTELGVNWIRDGLSVSATAYVTKVEDVVGETEQRELDNLGELETKGFTARVGYHWQAVSTSLSYNQSRPELNGEPLNDDTKGIGTAIGDTWVADIGYQVFDGLDIGYNGRYVARLTDVAEGYDEKAGYAVHDIYAQWLPVANQDLTLTLTIKNLLDKAYRSHASYGNNGEVAQGTLEPGRDIRFNVAYGF
ncbi:TonB-dependent receptor [Photobacterium makurazakiensis]|uniref:TonB-dependent receptor domain-containing protein n=1 Tax=Photobacterium makurazakiensis TaxID=2910234 RepID=UPI003D0C8C8B